MVYPDRVLSNWVRRPTYYLGSGGQHLGSNKLGSGGQHLGSNPTIWVRAPPCVLPEKPERWRQEVQSTFANDVRVLFGTSKRFCAFFSTKTFIFILSNPQSILSIVQSVFKKEYFEIITRYVKNEKHCKTLAWTHVL